MAAAPEDRPAANHDVWEPPVVLAWHQRWSRGWRLVLVLVALAAGYAVWRGKEDYRSLKAWRARQLAAEALDTNRTKTPEEAIALLDKAGTLAPNDPAVLRAIADFNEPRQDAMALYALRQLVNIEKADDADRERLCRLAFEWGHPELAPADTLKMWAATAPDQLDAKRLEFSGRWMASRGQAAAAVERMKLAAEKAQPEDVPAIQLALSQLEIASGGAPEVAEAAVARICSLISSGQTPSKTRREAVLYLVQLLSQPAAQPLLTRERADLLREAVAELQKSSADKPSEALSIQLAGVGLEMTLRPGERQKIAGELGTSAREQPDDLRLLCCKWLNQRGFFDLVLSLTDEEKLVSSQRDWCTVRLDALFGLRRWDDAEKLINSAPSPLPRIVRELFLHRIALVADRGDATAKTHLENLFASSGHAEPGDVLFAAGNLERMGDFPNAAKLYRIMQNHPQAALPARLGLIRCLDQQPDQVGVLREALESLLTLWPKSEEARGDLIYLKLLDGTATATERELAAEMARESSHYLSRRVTAALAALRGARPAEALALLDLPGVTWKQMRPGWQAVYAAVIAANGRSAEARDLADPLKSAPLRPGERELLAEFVQAKP